jgi:pilus assembly protein CpaB
MNNSNETRTLWVSLAAGLFAAFLVYSYSQEKKSEYDKKYGSMKRIVISARDIAEMETIDDTMLDYRNIPEDYIAPGFATEVDSVVGQVAGSPIKKGEQILMTKLLTPGPDTGISLQVSPGKRAVTLPVDEVRGVAKLIRPGDRVDVLAAVDVGKGITAHREVSVILQDVPVLATGLNVVNNIPRIFEVDGGGKNVTQITLSGDTKFNTLTVETDPKQAQELVFIVSTQPGNIFLMLRNPNDRGQLRMPSTTVETIIGKTISYQGVGVESAAAAASGVVTPAAAPKK